MRAFSFPLEIDNVLDGLGDKQADFVKEAVIEKAQREGLLTPLEQFSESEPQTLSWAYLRVVGGINLLLMQEWKE